MSKDTKKKFNSDPDFHLKGYVTKDWLRNRIITLEEQIAKAPLAYAVKDVENGQYFNIGMDEIERDNCILLNLADGRYKKVKVKLLEVE